MTGVQTCALPISTNDFSGLLDFAIERGFEEREEGYVSKCHACADMRRHLSMQGEYKELKPDKFYRFLET